MLHEDVEFVEQLLALACPLHEQVAKGTAYSIRGT